MQCFVVMLGASLVFYPCTVLFFGVKVIYIKRDIAETATAALVGSNVGYCWKRKLVHNKRFYFSHLLRIEPRLALCPRDK
jgi:hypothetical protein